jgi:hypothetical protein
MCTRIQIPLPLLSFSAAKQLYSLFGHYLALYSVADSGCNKSAAYRKIARFVNNMANLSNLTGLRLPAAGFGFVDCTGISTVTFILASECWNPFFEHPLILLTSILPRITVVSNKMPKITMYICSGAKFCFSCFQHTCMLLLQLSCAM